MKDKIPTVVRDDLDTLSMDEIEFLEEEVFRAYDNAFDKYYRHDADNREEVALYERALETVSTIRKIKENMNEDKIRQGKEFRDLIDDK